MASSKESDSLKLPIPVTYKKKVKERVKKLLSSNEHT